MVRDRTWGEGLRASMVTLGLKVAATGAGWAWGYHCGSGFSLVETVVSCGLGDTRRRTYAACQSCLLNSACWALSWALVSFGFGCSSAGFSSSFYKV